MSEYDPQLETMENSIQEIDALLNDFNRELSSYVEEMTFDSEAFYETEKRLDLLNGLKAKYGRDHRRHTSVSERTAEKTGRS